MDQSPKHPPPRKCEQAATFFGGYNDAESWWHDMFEVSGPETDVFAALARAMAALRDGEPAAGDDIPREAHMRLAIAEAAKDEGPIPCGKAA
jgi:hypothetical protein